MAVDRPGEASPPMIRLGGIALEVPARWEARISASSLSLDGVPPLPVTHAATIPLPSTRGDYGSNVVERLGPKDIFVSLVEFAAEAADTALFPAVQTFPSEITATEFHPAQLQRVIPGQAGKQVFFTLSGRAFCLYVVFGSFALRNQLSAEVSTILRAFRVEAHQ